MINTVDSNTLKQLANKVPSRPEGTILKFPRRGEFNLDEWIAENGLSVWKSGPWQGGKKYILESCPWNPDHEDQSAYIVQFSNGAIAAGCQHLGCADKDWRALRDTVEPGWRERCGETGDESTQSTQTNSVMRELRTLSLGELLAQSDDEVTDELVERLIPAGGAALIGGKPGEGKTWLALVLALSIAKGIPFLGRFACQQGAVLIIDEENGDKRLRKRLRKLCKAMDIDSPESVPIEIASMNGVDLTDSTWVDRVADKMREARPVLVIVDSLVRVHRGDENSSRDMAKLFAKVNELRKEFGAAFLFTHHLRKRGFINDISDRIRGSSDIEAYVDAMFGLEQRDNRLVLRQLKNRDGEPMKPLALELKDIGEGTNIIVLGEVDEMLEKIALAKQLVRELLADGTKLREELVDAARAVDISERTLTEALKQMFEALEIIRRKDGRKTTYTLPSEPIDADAIDDQELSEVEEKIQ